MRRLPMKAWCLLLVLGLSACGGSDGPSAPAVPGAPRLLEALPGDGQVTVSWSAPSEQGDSPIQGYVVRARVNGGVSTSQESTATSVTLSGLTNGQTYTLVVAARNAQGEGPESSPSSPVIPHDIPGAPRDVTATPGDRQAEVAWSPPDAVDMPVTGYVVTVRQGDTVVSTVNSAELRTLVSGLTNGTDYRVTVAATNAVVGGPESAPVAVTPVSVPGAPRVELFNRARTWLAVQWEVEDTGGSPITGYVAELRLDGEVVQSFETTETLQHFPGLTTGAAYRVTVTARNAQGQGAAGEISVLRPCDKPLSPTRLLIEPGDGQLSLSWGPPADLGGCELQDYRIDFQTRSGANPVRVERTPARSLVVTGLVNGVQYDVTVRVSTEVGDADRGVMVQATPHPAPEAPRNLAATPGDGHVMLAWEPPPDVGAPLTRYVLTVEPEVEGLYLIAGANVREWWAEGLTNGTTYTFTIRAENRVGQSPPATIQATPAP
ncbi:fibronectin type III domain-containing protein [Comamonas sp. JC664]|uniref:fibronectin type III domain-containing protein n=1 Tax=Comamonas sp. JC664 TaxID=2801917 RepID=UPI00174B0BD0|nr:fibronectin type III domain-containing protein [Comamonas sp. JC664]MBL0697217.1 fibronectin type III domain-containing protein [Comamonas sp. JC664]